MATRPRFSRGRRTWNLNVRNLIAEDVRALDVFQQVTVQRGSLAFLYPNLLPNGSFEIPALAAPPHTFLTPGGEIPIAGSSIGEQVFEGWTLSDATGFQVQGVANAVDGTMAAQIASIAAFSLPIGGYAIGEITSHRKISVKPNEVYVFVAQIDLAVAGSLPGGVALGAGASATLTFADGTSQQSLIITATPGSGFLPLTGTITIPATSVAGSLPQSLSISLYLDFRNNSAATTTFAALGSPLSLSATLDSVGLALQSAPQIYGRMVGSTPLPFPVRFAPNKLPQFSDLGFGDGVKVYGSTFALEEV